MQVEEATIAGLSRAMAEGSTSAVELVTAYLDRIAAIDRSGPTLRSVIELNPDALEIAAALDAERASVGPRGALHGLPIVLKDNIDTGDRMTTTAGSLALEGHRAERDAHLVTRLRRAGAVVLGKTNMSEWAYFRSKRGCSGWSSRGGQVRNPYALDRNPCGSSSGSGVAVAANLAVAAIGTETDGSIVCPASVNGVVGVKPTVGLVSRTGIVPVAHSQDTAGPMARTVADAAAILDALAGEDPADPATRGVRREHAGAFAAALDEGALRGARIGVARAFFGRHEGSDAVAERALLTLGDLGAVLVDPVELGDPGAAQALSGAELTVLLYEFKADLDRYLRERPGAPVRSLAEVIAFNREHADAVLPYFGQELMELAQAKGPLSDAAYRDARALCLRGARDEGIDRALREHALDALVAPTATPAWSTDPIVGDKILGLCASPPAMAGYPHVSVPAGHVHGLPVGLSFFGGALHDARLLAFAFAFEAATRVRRPPGFPPSVA